MSTDTPAELLHSPLHDAHVALGATMGAFGGWEMPISYAGGGVVAEHTAVRTTVGIFDVSHLGKAGVTGPGAAEFVNSCLTADLAKIGPGQAQYLTEHRLDQTLTEVGLGDDQRRIHQGG